MKTFSRLYQKANPRRWAMGFSLLFIGTYTFGQTADLILTNGKIFTSDTAALFVEALAIKENLILSTGSNIEIQKLAGVSTKVIDLQGKTVVPGFNNAHDHLGWNSPIGKQVPEPFSVPGPSKRKTLESVAEMVKDAKPGQWIRGMIGLTVLYDETMKRKLDSIAPNNPVLLQIMWGHGIILNKKAMEVVGLSETEPDPLGGWYGRKAESDTLNGKIYEYAQWPIWSAWIGSEQDNLIASIQGYMQEMLSYGITTTQDLSAMISPTQVEEVFSKVDPPLRLRIIPFPGTTKNGRNLTEWRSINNRPSPLTKISGVKYLIDGTPLDQTALSKKPYENRPDWYGSLNMPIDTIKTILKEAIESDTQLLLHAVGDSSVAIILPLIKEAGSPEIWKKKRLRLEHSIPTESLTKAQMQDLKNMGIVLMPTPQYLGPSPMASLFRNQIPLGIAPDMLTNPFVNIMIISSHHVDPGENLTREEAVIAYTLGNAFAEFAEHEKGTLSKGKLADLAVLTHDIFTMPAEQLPMVRSILTMVDGKIVYRVED